MGKLKTYLSSTSSIPFSVLSTLPLLLGYYTLLFISASPVKNAAENWIQQIVGASPESYSIGIGVIYMSSILYVLFKKNYSLDAFRKNFHWMILESITWAILSWVLISLVLQSILLTVQTTNAPLPYLAHLGMSLGAGIFEELLFRVLIQGGIYILLERLLSFDKWLSAMIAVIVSSILFSLAHYIGSAGDVFELSSFLYRLVFGMFFSVLIHFRGFAVTSWTHSLYDVIVVSF